MRIGLIALSGVRVEDPELRALGLTLPAVVERGRVVAELPTLSLLTLAALTPRDVAVEYREARDLSDPLPDYDLVAISTLSAQAFEAYELARRFRARGAAVVLGGLHASAVPEEAARHATSVVVGEAEPVWPRVVQDFLDGELQPRYRAAAEYDLRDAPLPRFELLDTERYNRFTVQTTRGCPYDCDFCASSIRIARRYKHKPVDRVIAEVRRIKELRRRPFLELADDNSFAARGTSRDLLRALAAEDVRWFTETDVSIAEDGAFLDAMREAGCREVLVGLETPRAAGLDGIELRGDWKRRQHARYEAAVRAIQSRGIAVNGCFVLGLDGDTEDVFDEVFDFVERTSLYDVQLTVMTPFPGTPLYERLRREGRILRNGAWNECTLFDVNYAPRHMSPETLRERFRDLVARVYDPDTVLARRARFLETSSAP